MIMTPDVAVTGLTELAVRARTDAGQVNTAPPVPGRSLLQILRANVLTRFNAILGVLFAVVLVVGPPQDALFGAVLVINTGIGVAQELRAKRALDRLAILTAGRARVVRDGAVTEIALDEIVLDDVLELGRGDQVPVDGTVLRADGLELDEALLTGEAGPVRKQPGDQVLSGSAVVAGTARIRAVRVGGDAYAARLQAHARRFSLIRSELQRGTNQILRLVTWVMIPAGLLLIGSEFLRSHDPLRDAARGSAAGVVAMVPEGLVLLTSLAFAAGALRLARHRVLVQELAAIEGLARADVLCIDKTGTLTEPGLRLIAAEVVTGRAGAPAAEAIGALAAADEAPNETGRLLIARYPAPAGWVIRRRVPFSSARKWSGASFDGRGTWLLGALPARPGDHDQGAVRRRAPRGGGDRRPGRDPGRRAAPRRLHAGRGGDRCRAGVGERPRPGPPRAEAGRGQGAAGGRARGRDVRRRRQRRAGPQAGRSGHRDGFWQPGQPFGGPGGAAGRDLRRHRADAGRGAPGGREHRAGRQAVRDQDGVRGAHRGRRRDGRDHLPLLPPAPDHRQRSHHRVPGFFLALAPGAPRARPGFTRRVLTFTVPAGTATAAAALACYAITRSAGYATASRTAAMLAVLAMGLWVLGLVAGRPAIRRIVLITAMGACVVPLLAIPAARRILALQLPPAPVLGACAGVVLAAVAALTLWRRWPGAAGQVT